MMVIYGDSYTSGENNGNISFADYFEQEKHGVSGSCLDNYSIYPVRDGGFISSYQDCSKTVLLEYGINDAASLVTKYTNANVIKVSIAKAADLLKNNNVYFLALAEKESDLMSFCVRYVNYLNNDYLRKLYKISSVDYAHSYSFFVGQMQRKFKTLYMLPNGFKDFDKDGIHPNDKGYRIIAKHLKEQLSR